MPENEFEKKVSSELQQLKFKPSETVWMKVEERIQKKKKRRVFIIVFLLAGIALLGYWQWDNLFGGKKNEITQTETSTIEKNDNSDKNNETVKKENNPNKEKQTENTEVKNKEEDGKEKIVKTISTDKQSNDIFSKSPVQKVKEKKQNNITVEKKRIEPGNKKSTPKQTQQREVGLTNNDLIVVTPDKPTKTKDDVQRSQEVNNVDHDANKNLKPTDVKIDPAKLSNINSDNVNQVKPLLKPDSVIKKDSLIKKIDSVSKAVPVDSPVVKLPKSLFDKKWKWGAQFVPGLSFLNENGFTFNMSKSADALSYQSPSAGNGGVAPQQKPSKVKPGFAFQFGGFLQKQLSQKTNFSLGLQYGFYSNHIGIGFRRDSLLRFAFQVSSLQDANSVYNAGGDTVHYTNRYHFIEFPIRFQWQLNKNKTWPISLNAGASISYLFATNALVYDTAFNGIYFQNNKMLNRTQFSLSTGVSFTIANNRRMQWALGPFMDFHLNKLVDNPFDRKKYLLFTGIRTSIVFNK